MIHLGHRAVTRAALCSALLVLTFTVPRGAAQVAPTRAIHTFSMKIDNLTVSRILGAEVRISPNHPSDGTKGPMCEFSFRVPTDDKPMIAEWALAPNGPKRFKPVQLTTQHFARNVRHTWTMPRGYVHSFTEVETAQMSSQQYAYMHVVVRGALSQDGAAYDGSNIMQIQTAEDRNR